jgi:hypothetical protein
MAAAPPAFLWPSTSPLNARSTGLLSSGMAASSIRWNRPSSLMRRRGCERALPWSDQLQCLYALKYVDGLILAHLPKVALGDMLTVNCSLHRRRHMKRKLALVGAIFALALLGAAAAPLRACTGDQCGCTDQQRQCLAMCAPGDWRCGRACTIAAKCCALECCGACPPSCGCSGGNSLKGARSKSVVSLQLVLLDEANPATATGELLDLQHLLTVLGGDECASGEAVTGQALERRWWDRARGASPSLLASRTGWSRQQ